MFSRHTVWPAIFLLFVAATAHAAPQCVRPSAARESIVPVNGFAQNSAPRTIVTTHARCAWGLGLATLPIGTGTAFIIANRREVMTNMHVVDKHCLGNRHFTFSHGFDLGGDLGTIPATVVAHGDYCTGAARGHHVYGGDWAVAVLDRDPAKLEHTSPGELLQPRDSGEWLNDNGHYFLLGYGMLYRGGLHPYRSAPCRLGRLFVGGLVEHNCDASHRSSGSPIVIDDAAGHCLVAALHEGEIESAPGRPAYRDDVNANVAVLSTQFAAAVKAVARELEQGRSAGEIAADLARHPPGR
jgi:hypothetical protein